jgi:hypothetical protein
MDLLATMQKAAEGWPGAEVIDAGDAVLVYWGDSRGRASLGRMRVKWVHGRCEAVGFYQWGQYQLLHKDPATLPAFLAEAVRTLRSWAVPDWRERLHVPQDATSGLAAIKGRWPSDETDEQIADGLTELRGDKPDLPQFFDGPPINITGGKDSADYVDELRGEIAPTPPLRVYFGVFHHGGDADWLMETEPNLVNVFADEENVAVMARAEFDRMRGEGECPTWEDLRGEGWQALYEAALRKLEAERPRLNYYGWDQEIRRELKAKEAQDGPTD